MSPGSSPGWFTDPAPFFTGPLDPAEAEAALGEGMEPLYEALQGVSGLVTGMVGARRGGSLVTCGAGARRGGALLCVVGRSLVTSGRAKPDHSWVASEGLSR